MDQELLVDQPLGEKLIKKGFWLYFFSFLVAPAGYLIKVIISNSVSVADVGVLYSIIGLITFLNVYNDLGLTESLQYFLPRYWIKKQYNYVKTSIYLSLFAQVFTAIIIALFLWLGAPWLAENYFHSPSAVVILKYFCFYFLGINIFQILQSVFVAFQNTFSFQFVDFVRMWSIVGFTFFFFITGRQSIERYSLNRILGLIFGIFVAGILFYKNYRKTLLQGKIVFEKPMLKEYFNYAFWCFVGINVSQLFGQIIQQLIIVILGPESAGYYTNFFSMFIISITLIGPIIALIFPLVSELITKKDSHKLSILYSFFYTYFTVFSVLLAMFFMVLGPESALVLFGEKFVFSGEMFSWGSIFTIFTTFVGFNFAVIAGMGKIKERVKILLISVIVVTIVSLVGLYTIGIYGSVLALGIGYVLLFILSFRLIYKHIQFDVDWKFILKNTILALILSTGLWMIKSELFVFDDMLRYSNLSKLLGLGLTFFLIFVGINWKRTMMLKNEVMRIRGE
ncbi:polysaccharide biosynthesis protein [candidate division SR1 bacterium RAAC1_SR1_1]|nr:polysaccharide biosynthesis protein [candidate division SR1 bacterium RAAC1_SR1_1]